MAYEATVPVHRRLLWSALVDPERLLGAVPNLVVEASTEQGVAARLRLRIGDRSITFRGIARLVELVPEQLRAVLEIEAVHGRSDGAVEGRVELRLLAAGGGTKIVIEPELELSGRAPTVAAERLAEAAGRLIPRWFDQLASTAPEPRPATAVTTLTVVPDAAAEVDGKAEAGTDAVPDEAAAPQPPAPVPAAAAQVPPAPPQLPPVSEPQGPTLTLITGEAQDVSPSQKAPLRLVPDAEQDADAEATAEPDLWSRGRGRLPGPLWILAAAGLGVCGLTAVLLRRLLRRG
ncbi:MAG TPA: SRPBCC domain-containing protein [Actinospica sp.]|nr:SRPBCC domain-containing protein [Actinospica sp.]